MATRALPPKRHVRVGLNWRKDVRGSLPDWLLLCSSCNRCGLGTKPRSPWHTGYLTAGQRADCPAWRGRRRPGHPTTRRRSCTWQFSAISSTHVLSQEKVVMVTACWFWGLPGTGAAFTHLSSKPAQWLMLLLLLFPLRGRKPRQRSSHASQKVTLLGERTTQ